MGDAAQPQIEPGGPKDAQPKESPPAEVQQLLEKLPPPDAKTLLSVFLARSSTTFGPDPETAKIVAQSEMHEEECRLKAYQASLANKESQAQRDHEFRKKKLNHNTGKSAVVLIVVVAGVVAGLVLSVTGNATIGSPVLIASFTMLSGMGGKLIKSGEEDQHKPRPRFPCPVKI